MPRQTPLFLMFAALALLACGCRRTAPTGVTGAVTYKGQPIAKGHVTFYPDEGGTETTLGSEIKDGCYQIADIKPGRRRVLITTAPALDVSDTKTLKIAAWSPITAATPGNNRIVEIKKGPQVLDFDLGK
jgi:hypothetical protein